MPRRDNHVVYEKDGTKGIRIQGWDICTHHESILKNEEIEKYSDELGFNMPEMIFGNNYFRAKRTDGGHGIELCALDALRQVKTGPNSYKEVQVRIAENWTNRSRYTGINEVVKPFDWTFTTNYPGRCLGSLEFVQTTKYSIDYDKLREPEPILFYNEVMLFEDDLGDNGMSRLSFK
ncbi:Tap42 interacting protein, partial [Spiromyces aspiralis]